MEGLVTSQILKSTNEASSRGIKCLLGSSQNHDLLLIRDQFDVAQSFEFSVFELPIEDRVRLAEKSRQVEDHHLEPTKRVKAC